MSSFRRLLLQRCAFLLFTAFVVNVCWCAAATREGYSVIPSPADIDDPLGSSWAIGDLDGDRQIDIAQNHEIGRGEAGYIYGVQLRLSHSRRSDLFTFSNADGLGVSLVAVDVDGDLDLDLVISGRLLGQMIGVWINDG